MAVGALALDVSTGALSTVIDTRSDEFVRALAQASEEQGMPDYYQPCVRPLFNMPMSQWPMCCGSRCEPCSQTLVAVAVRVCELLNIDSAALPERMTRSVATSSSIA